MMFIRCVLSHAIPNASFLNGKTLSQKTRYRPLATEVMMHTIIELTMSAQATAVTVESAKVRVISAVKRVTGAQHARIHKEKEGEVGAIIRADPAIMDLMLPRIAGDLMGKNLDRVINVEKRATGAPIVLKLVAATKKIS